MEDAVDALKMAFSVFAFILALSIVFAMFSQAREVSDIVIAHSDNTYYAQYADVTGETNGRTVGIETVLPTLYRYYKENLAIEINNSEIYELFDTDIERAIRSGNDAYIREYGKYYTENNSDPRYNPTVIPWLGSPNIDTQKRVSLFISGDSGAVNGITLKRYENINLNNYKNSTFRENFEYRDNSEKIEADDGSVVYIRRDTEKSHITYTLN